MPKTTKGFTLIELLVVIAIIGILAAMVVIVINPLELVRSARDSVRIQDVNEMLAALNIDLHNYPDGLCHGLTIPCTGKSIDPPINVRHIDGTGWIKYDFVGTNTVTVAVLPTDPINDDTYYYEFYSDGTNYEIDTKLESEKFKDKMFFDGGDNIDLYEVGSSTILLH